MTAGSKAYYHRCHKARRSLEAGLGAFRRKDCTLAPCLRGLQGAVSNTRASLASSQRLVLWHTWNCTRMEHHSPPYPFVTAPFWLSYTFIHISMVEGWEEYQKSSNVRPADVADRANSTRPTLYCSKTCGAGQNGAVTSYNQCLSGSRVCET